jgi:hypothetical protein
MTLLVSGVRFSEKNIKNIGEKGTVLLCRKALNQALIATL